MEIITTASFLKPYRYYGDRARPYLTLYAAGGRISFNAAAVTLLRVTPDAAIMVLKDKGLYYIALAPSGQLGLPVRTSKTGNQTAFNIYSSRLVSDLRTTYNLALGPGKKTSVRLDIEPAGKYGDIDIFKIF